MQAIWLLPLLLIPAGAAPFFDVTDLGALGGSTTQALGLSTSGQVVGMATTLFGNMHAIEFGVSGNTDLTANSAASQGIATGVNGSGRISGTQYIGGQAYATIWDNGQAQTLAGAGSYGQAIDSKGDVAGMMVANGQGHAFVTSNGTVVDLGTLPGGAWSSAYAINDSGAAAGYGMSGSAMTAFFWSPTTGYILLGTLGGASGYGMAINDAGAVAGDAQTSSGAFHAVVWTDGRRVYDLGTLGGSNSFAFGLNNAGDAVGYSLLSGNAQTHAFLFEAGVMLDLNNLIAPGSGWTLTEAYAINAGKQIVGSGLLNGVEHAFLLTDPPGDAPALSSIDRAAPAVPEPATSVLTGMGIAALALVRRLSRPARNHPSAGPLPR
jgi:probable HAF family extracellular repeat protein